MPAQLLADGSLEGATPTAGWVLGTGVTATVRTDGPDHGTKYVRIACSTTGARTIGMEPIPVTPGLTYSIVPSLRLVAGANSPWRLGFAWADANGASITPASTTVTPTLTSGWTRPAATSLLAPDGAAVLRGFLNRVNAGSAAGDTIDVDARVISEGFYDGAYIDPPAPGDTTAPTVPGSVAATATGSTSIGVSWAASTDAVGVEAYRVQRGGVTVAAAVTGTTWSDTGLSPSTLYSYTVSAVDASGNRSAESSPATATTNSGALPDLFTPAGTTPGATVANPPHMVSSVRHAVHVAELPDMTAVISRSAVTNPTTVVVAFAGGRGDNYWTANLPSSQLVDDLAAAGKILVSVFWDSAWFTAPSGVRAGMSRMGARVAAVVESVLADYPGADLHVIGGSWGTQAVANFISFYDPLHQATKAVMTAGPYPHVRRLCSTLAEDEAYSGRPPGSTGGAAATGWIDEAYGYLSGGPCDVGAEADFDAMYYDSDYAKATHADLDWTARQVAFFYGELDPDATSERINTQFWHTELDPAVSPHTSAVLTGVGHNVHGDQGGVDAILGVLLDTPSGFFHFF